MEIEKYEDGVRLHESGVTRAWIPAHEYALMQELNKQLTPEEHRRLSYFFWNNFSMEGYEDKVL